MSDRRDVVLRSKVIRLHIQKDVLIGLAKHPCMDLHDSSSYPLLHVDYNVLRLIMET